jgi:SAM-dependent methyltransferase
VEGTPRESASGVDDASVARMRERWRTFARDDPMHYVAANREDWDADAFYSMGRNLAEDVLTWAGEDLGRERMIEIGCGAGRMLVHFAPRFERVDGVDIAPEMIEEARAHMPANVVLTVTSGAGLEPFEDASFDFAFSVQVFQHVPERAVVGAYIHECGRILRPGGRAVLQFDSRPNSLLRRLTLQLPDRLLPRDHRRYIRRYPVPPEWPARTGAEAGLAVLDQRGAGTDTHLVLFERA